MIKLALSFLLGVLLFQTCRELPAIFYLVGFPILVLIWLKIPQTLFLLIILAGFVWSHLFAYQKLYPQLATQLINQDLVIEGTIEELSVQSNQYSRFIFSVSEASVNYWNNKIPSKVQLSWYRPPIALNKSQSCRFTVRLKKPWGFSNPGSQDYEKSLFLKAIAARGYVRDGNCSASVAEDSLLRSIREKWIGDFIRLSAQYKNAALMQALTFAYRENMTQQQWEILRKTGTAHLLAISGLHLSAVAFVIFYSVQTMCRLSSTLCNMLPARNIASIVAIIFVLFYAYLAGFTLPTQRALIMVTLALSAVLLRVPIFSFTVYACALLLVLLFNPLAVLSPGFWMSFLAVLFIFVGLNATQSLQTKKLATKFLRVVILQVYLGVAIFPISLLYFSEASIIAPMVNLIAIPIVSFILLPLLLFAQCAFLLNLFNVEWLFSLIDNLFNALWWALSAAAKFEFAAWQYAPTLIGVICFEIGLFLLVQAKGAPIKNIALLLLPALVLIKQPALKTGELRMTVLDVGQGLSVVIETPQHTLLYDAGMSTASGFNTGETVVMPYLQSRGIDKLDLAIVSHNDNDHAGGMHWLLDNFSIEILMVSNQPQLYSKIHSTLCRAHDEWQWENVKFRVLHPPDKWQSNDNNRSCVLQIFHPVGTILLTGDIEKSAEDWLIEQYGDNLASDLITAPHHGSQSSSSYRFVDRVDPQTVVFSAGYMNRYGFPHATIRQRYAHQGAHIVDTIHQGAITFLFDDESVQMQTGHRVKSKRYWHSTQ